MTGFYKKIFFTKRFFIAFGAVIAVFAFSFVVPWLFPAGQTLLAALVAVTITDALLLFGDNKQLRIERKLPSRLSLGDENEITISIKNSSRLSYAVRIIDELPFQLQQRDFSINLEIKPDETRVVKYQIRPLVRGKYDFGHVNVFLSSFISFISRKDIHSLNDSAPVYPSIIQMKKYELSALPHIMTKEGIKRLRKIGHSYEFEQIKNYVIGDDSRSINWKASGRRGDLMVNQYEDERSQQIYSIIDKSRVMRMPFNGLTLLDYAINTSLVISNVVLQKYDKAGLITFSDKIGSVIPADRQSNQLHKIMESLYNEQEHYLEADYELLFHVVRNVVRNRSLLFLYSNFESTYALERVLPILRRLNRFHLLVIMFFENDELVEFSNKPCEDLEGIYHQTMARKFIQEKRQIMNELGMHGIQSIVSKPDELSINTINKYLELKSRGLI